MSGTSGIFSRERQSLKAIKDFRFLIYQLVRVSLLGAYKKSYFGLMWMFLAPVLAVIMWILLHSAGIIEPGDTGIPYPAYVLLSTSIWGFFMQSYKNSSSSITGNSKLLIMNSFPVEVLIVRSIAVQLIKFSIPLIINLIVLLAFGIKFTWLALLFPLTLIPLLMAGMTIGLVVSLMKVVLTDVVRIIDRGMKILMLLTPVVYAPKVKIKWLSVIVDWNPLTYLIGFSRDVLTMGTLFHPKEYLITISVLSILFFFVLRIFLKTSPVLMHRLFNN